VEIWLPPLKRTRHLLQVAHCEQTWQTSYQIFLCESERLRSVFAPLRRGQRTAAELQPIFRRACMDHLRAARERARHPPKNPLDLDVSEAVEFLESQVENGKSGL
jgi:hypothetical protein